MLGDCFRRGRILAVDDGSDSDLDPVLLVSGMGGSILNARNKKNGLQIRAWVRIFLANFEFKKHLRSLYNPKTGYTESLDENVEIVVPEDDYGLHAIDNLDPSMVSLRPLNPL
ncbi:hypothetical protein MRB53_035164 [Persea americana]|uniref:Uncharacterized protein n=1 Tax=Persea americana TaxID=3435 RepID=A0ACC2K3V0_PERAE|nr:hypothetical protein MRB53_035164 [Persea americana]